MEIIRHEDGSLTVPVAPERQTGDDDTAKPVEPGPTEMVIRPGEGGYNEALAEWDLQQNPDRGEAVSTASGREQAMAVVHAVAEDPDHVAEAVESLDDPEAGAEALRHVLIGGTPSVQAFAVRGGGGRRWRRVAAPQGHQDHRRGARRDRHPPIGVTSR